MNYRHGRGRTSTRSLCTCTAVFDIAAVVVDEAPLDTRRGFASVTSRGWPSTVKISAAFMKFGGWGQRLHLGWWRCTTLMSCACSGPGA